MPAGPGFERNFPEAPGRVTPCWRRRRRGSGKDSGILFPFPKRTSSGPLPGSPRTSRVWEEGAILGSCFCTVCHSGELRGKSRDSGEGTLPSPPSHPGRVGTAGPAPRRPAAGHAALEDAASTPDPQDLWPGQSPCLGSKHWAIFCKTFHPSPPGTTPFQRGTSWILEEGAAGVRPRRGGLRAGGGRSRDRCCPRRPEGSCSGGQDPGRGAPRHTGRRPFLGSHSSKQSPEPLVPAAAKAWMSPSGRAHGYRGHYKFPALHRAQPRPRAHNKRFSSLSHRLCGAPSSTTEPTPGAGHQQRSSSQRPPALEGTTLAPAFAPGLGAPENPTLSGPLCSLPAGPKVSPGPGPYTRVPLPGSTGRRRACAPRGWGSSKRGAPRSPGHGAERSGGLGSRLLPQGRATLGRQTPDKIRRRNHKADSACRPRPRDPPPRAGPPGRWGAPGRPGRTFSVHRRAGGRGSERAGTACIPFSNPLSRRSLRAASCALSSASLCHSYMCAGLFGGEQSRRLLSGKQTRCVHLQ
ncbi:uncharacterized protein [Canis lupus baileyi]|uniref:uncharacterized protein n=1 Tax=Canis lupus baileyi TaxID=143281 RepID=UPI003B9773E7